MIAEIKRNSKPAEAGDRIIGQEIKNIINRWKRWQSHYLNYSSVTTAVVLFCVNFYAIILPPSIDG